MTSLHAVLSREYFLCLSAFPFSKMVAVTWRKFLIVQQGSYFIKNIVNFVLFESSCTWNLHPSLPFVISCL